MTALRTFDTQIAGFLNTDRLRAWNLVLGIALAVCCAGYLATSNNAVDLTGKPVGTDFTSFYAASSLALSGHPEGAYQPAVHAAAQNAVFGHEVPYAAFFYPPIYLLYCLPLALFPYLLSLALWQGVTFAGYFQVTRRFAGPKLDWLAIATFPAVLINAGHGQNAFLSAALFGAGLLCLNTRPILAGVLLGCLVYKPQLGIVIPFVLVLQRRWVTIAAAAATVVGLAGAATALFGADIWKAFVANMPLAGAVLERELVDAYKLQSTYAAVRVIGGTHGLAMACQGVVTLAVLVGLAWATLKAPRPEDVAPVMVVAATLVSPFLLDYDLVLLAIPLAWLFAEARRTGFRPYERTVMFLVFILPLFARTVAKSTEVPLAPLVIGVFFVLMVRRVAQVPQQARTAPSQTGLPGPCEPLLAGGSAK